MNLLQFVFWNLCIFFKGGIAFKYPHPEVTHDLLSVKIWMSNSFADLAHQLSSQINNCFTPQGCFEDKKKIDYLAFRN